MNVETISQTDSLARVLYLLQPYPGSRNHWSGLKGSRYVWVGGERGSQPNPNYQSWRAATCEAGRIHPLTTNLQLICPSFLDEDCFEGALRGQLPLPATYPLHRGNHQSLYALWHCKKGLPSAARPSSACPSPHQGGYHFQTCSCETLVSSSIFAKPHNMFAIQLNYQTIIIIPLFTATSLYLLTPASSSPPSSLTSQPRAFPQKLSSYPADRALPRSVVSGRNQQQEGFELAERILMLCNSLYLLQRLSIHKNILPIFSNLSFAAPTQQQDLPKCGPDFCTRSPIKGSTCCNIFLLYFRGGRITAQWDGYELEFRGIMRLKEGEVGSWACERARGSASVGESILAGWRRGKRVDKMGQRSGIKGYWAAGFAKALAKRVGIRWSKRGAITR